MSLLLPIIPRIGPPTSTHFGCYCRCCCCWRHCSKRLSFCQGGRCCRFSAQCNGAMLAASAPATRIAAVLDAAAIALFRIRQSSIYSARTNSICCSVVAVHCLNNRYPQLSAASRAGNRCSRVTSFMRVSTAYRLECNHTSSGSSSSKRRAGRPFIIYIYICRPQIESLYEGPCWGCLEGIAK